MRKPARHKPVVIGVTGSMGCGKSTVSSMLREKGCLVIDADRLAHACLEPAHRLHKRLCAAFGLRICTASGGGISRRKLAELVFNDTRKLRTLNALIHPEVARGLKERIARTRAGCVVCDIPLLFEAGLQRLMDIVIVVSVRPTVQNARIRKQRRLSAQQVRARINAQMPLEKKRQLADFVIDNNGTILETKKKVESTWKEVQLMIKKRQERR